MGENEGIDSALRRFKRQVSKAGILADVKYHRHFETPLDVNLLHLDAPDVCAKRLLLCCLTNKSSQATTSNAIILYYVVIEKADFVLAKSLSIS